MRGPALPALFSGGGRADARWGHRSCSSGGPTPFKPPPPGVCAWHLRTQGRETPPKGVCWDMHPGAMGCRVGLGTATGRGRADTVRPRHTPTACDRPMCRKENHPRDCSVLPVRAPPR